MNCASGSNNWGGRGMCVCGGESVFFSLLFSRFEISPVLQEKAARVGGEGGGRGY